MTERVNRPSMRTQSHFEEKYTLLHVCVQVGKVLAGGQMPEGVAESGVDVLHERKSFTSSMI